MMDGSSDIADPANTVAAAATPVKPESWEQEVWDKLVDAEQWVVNDLHEIGIVFAQDVWPTIKSALGLLTSQLGLAVLGAITANITDPALIPAAVGSAIVLTASTSGVVDVKNAIASAQAAIAADPTVQSLLPTDNGGSGTE